MTNADKQQHGQSAQNGLEQILLRCKASGYITYFIKNYRIGKDGYRNTEQFYVPFLIVFSDNIKWALFTTTSMRTDRIKGQQWDAINLKSIDSTITKAYLIYPDGIAEYNKNEFVRQNNKYVNEEEYTALDAVLSQDQISNLIERHALNYMTIGQLKDKQGNSFEQRIVSVLNYGENLQKWKTKSHTLEGMHYDIFRKIICCFKLDSASTIHITATSDKNLIGKLPSGGNPKTDVLVRTVKYNGDVSFYTISCKRSSEANVSVHQYTADAFADVLNPEDRNLRFLLNEFQKSGSLRDFGESNAKALEKALEPYQTKLNFWVLGGYGGEGNYKQCAGFILTYNEKTEQLSVHTTEEYCEALKNAGVKGNFGSLFSWTYPSKRRGQSIQLKTKII